MLMQTPFNSCRSNRVYPQEIPCPAPHDMKKYPLGSSYVPMQVWEHLYDSTVAFEHGTLFEDLDFPFLATNCPIERRNQ